MTHLTKKTAPVTLLVMNNLKIDKDGVVTDSNLSKTDQLRCIPPGAILLLPLYIGSILGPVGLFVLLVATVAMLLR